jgi:hypothetical protein
MEEEQEEESCIIHVASHQSSQSLTKPSKAKVADDVNFAEVEEDEDEDMGKDVDEVIVEPAFAADTVKSASSKSLLLRWISPVLSIFSENTLVQSEAFFR